jgi:hypothetical protein
MLECCSYLPSYSIGYWDCHNDDKATYEYNVQMLYNAIFMKNIKSYLLITSLLCVLTYLVGNQNGLKVGKKDASNYFKNNQTKNTDKNIAVENVLESLDERTDSNCGLSYLFPTNISTTEAQIEFVCEDIGASQEAGLINSGYYKINTEKEKAIWIYIADKKWLDLVQRTIRRTNSFK